MIAGTRGVSSLRKLSAYANRSDVIVLGLPRGGVPVAYEVAGSFNFPLDAAPRRMNGCGIRTPSAPRNFANPSVRRLPFLLRILDWKTNYAERIIGTKTQTSS